MRPISSNLRLNHLIPLVVSSSLSPKTWRGMSSQLSVWRMLLRFHSPSLAHMSTLSLQESLCLKAVSRLLKLLTEGDKIITCRAIKRANSLAFNWRRKAILLFNRTSDANTNCVTTMKNIKTGHIVITSYLSFTPIYFFPGSDHSSGHLGNIQYPRQFHGPVKGHWKGTMQNPSHVVILW